MAFSRFPKNQIIRSVTGSFLEVYILKNSFLRYKNRHTNHSNINTTKDENTKNQGVDIPKVCSIGPKITEP